MRHRALGDTREVGKLRNEGIALWGACERRPGERPFLRRCRATTLCTREAGKTRDEDIARWGIQGRQGGGGMRHRALGARARGRGSNHPSGAATPPPFAQGRQGSGGMRIVRNVARARGPGSDLSSGAATPPPFAQGRRGRHGMRHRALGDTRAAGERPSLRRCRATTLCRREAGKTRDEASRAT